MNRIELATTALRRAIEVRREAQVPRLNPLNVFDLAMGHLGLRVQFIQGSSFEGMFAKEQNAIMVPSERPHGRRAFSAAHELGHWAFGHGSQIDEECSLERYNDKPEERLVNMFAGYLLMLPPAIKSGAEQLGMDIGSPSYQQAYELACWFGVGYGTLVNHLRYGVQLLSPEKSMELLTHEPKTIRRHFVPNHATRHLVVACNLIPKAPIDLAVGDHLLVPLGADLQHSNLSTIEKTPLGILAEAKQSGISLINGPNGWAAAVRVMKKDFSGWAKYRHLEDDDEND
ncbi:MAG: ImmA/IrrE family metallo-endopeptidase [Verrucomicrobiaceae bacterium]|nr:ImmA/IrrE family metallo-endopeptidase [Verrucomicrobiaceae bacterium]